MRQAIASDLPSREPDIALRCHAGPPAHVPLRRCVGAFMVMMAMASACFAPPGATAASAAACLTALPAASHEWQPMPQSKPAAVQEAAQGAEQDAGAADAAAGAKAQDEDGIATNPEAALEALKAIVAAYRSEKGLEVRTKVRVLASEDGEQGAGPVVEAKFLFSSDRRAVVSFREYELRIAEGRIVATHASNPLAYLEVGDDGSPYYQLFNAFRALPFPELALALGEDDPGEVCMQLLPNIPNVVPVGVGDDEIEGQASRVLLLQSDDGSEELRLFYDPDTMLVERARGVLRGSDQVAEGAELVWVVESVASRPANAPDPQAFRGDTAGRQKVDGLAALVNHDSKAVEEARADRDVESLKAGEPAPELALPVAGGGADWLLSSEKPKPVVVDFWATWCGPCVGALPEMQALAKEFEGRATVMMVNTGEQGTREEREKRIAEVMKKRGASLPSALDLDGSAARRWLVGAFPTTFLVGPDGRIAGTWVGSSPRSQRELRDKLEALCPKAAPTDGAPAPK